jgi:transposase
MWIVPGEYSTGGKQKLLGTSKRGNKYLRRLFDVSRLIRDGLWDDNQRDSH